MAATNVNEILKAAKEDQVDEALAVAFQLLVRAVAQIQQAQKMQEQKIMQRLQEALQLQELKFNDLSQKVHRIQTDMEEEKEKSAEAMSAVVQGLEDRIQKLEEKVEIIDRKPSLILGRKGIESSGGVEARERLESHIGKLRMDVESTLDHVSTRVQSLEEQLENMRHSIVPSVSNSDSDSSFSNTLVSSFNVSSPHVDPSYLRLPNAFTSNTSKCSSMQSTTTPHLHLSSVKTSKTCSQSLPVALGCGFPSNNDLIQAVREGRINDVQKLLDGGADAEILDDKRNTPLHEAVYAGHTNIVSLLLDRGVNVNARNCIDDTALHFAASEVRTIIISLLIERNCDINARNQSGATALHLSAGNDLTGQCISLLVQAGAQIESRNIRGSTPLHLAASTGNVSGVKTLLAAGAKTNVKNNCGKTPFDLADTDAIHDLVKLKPKKK